MKIDCRENRFSCFSRFKCAISRILLYNFIYNFAHRRTGGKHMTTKKIIWQDVNKENAKLFPFFLSRSTPCNKTRHQHERARNWFFRRKKAFSISLISFCHCWLCEAWQSDSRSEITHPSNHRSWRVRFRFPLLITHPERRFSCNVIISRRVAVCLPSPCESSMVTGLRFEGSFEFSNATHTSRVPDARVHARDLPGECIELHPAARFTFN